MHPLLNTVKMQHYEPLTWLLLSASCCETEIHLPAAGQPNDHVTPVQRSAGAHAKLRKCVKILLTSIQLKHTRDCFVAWISACDPGRNAYSSATEASPQLQLSDFIWGSCFAHTPGCSAAASPVHHGLAAPCLRHKGFCSHIASLCWLQQEQHCISASDGSTRDF